MTFQKLWRVLVFLLFIVICPALFSPNKKQEKEKIVYKSYYTMHDQDRGNSLKKSRNSDVSKMELDTKLFLNHNCTENEAMLYLDLCKINVLNYKKIEHNFVITKFSKNPTIKKKKLSLKHTFLKKLKKRDVSKEIKFSKNIHSFIDTSHTNISKVNSNKTLTPTLFSIKYIGATFENVEQTCESEIKNKTNLTSNETKTSIFLKSRDDNKCKEEKRKTSIVFWVCLYIVAIFCLFIAIAIICDDFFVPSLETICEKLNLSEDVAGATFMAAGSSAPELFTSVAGLGTGSDVGVGAIVGSAVINLLVIVAMASAITGKILNIDWRPLVRDTTYYGASLLIFIFFAWDAIFRWWESLTMVILYILYIIMMRFNPQLINMMSSCVCCSYMEIQDDDDQRMREDDDEESSLLAAETPNHKNIETNKLTDVLMTSYDSFENDKRNSNHRIRNLEQIENFTDDVSQKFRSISADLNWNAIEEKSVFYKEESGEKHSLMNGAEKIAQVSDDFSEDDSKSNNSDSMELSTSSSSSRTETTEDEHNEIQEKKQDFIVLPCLPSIKSLPPKRPAACYCLEIVKYIGKWFLYVLSFPWICAFTWTIPNCSKDDNRKWYLVSFFMSLVWIGAISYFLVDSVEKIGCLLSVDTYTMGLVVVAVGSSVPDTISSVIVAKHGHGGMAVSNAVGSNIFDINLGLGLPLLLDSLVRSQPVHLLTSLQNCLLENLPLPLKLVPHVKFGFILLFVLLFFVLTFCAVRFRLNRRVGVVFLSVYLCFIAYAFVQEKVCLGYYC